MMKEIMNNDQVNKMLKRITHEIIERNQALDQVVLVGILKKGFPIALLLQENLKKFADIDIPTYAIDIRGYRDDTKEYLGNSPFEDGQVVDIANKTVVIVDDVLFTGRSVRATMDALLDYGRPDKIQLAVLVDRGHRELPIRADYIGRNLPTSKSEKIVVNTEDLSIYLDEFN
ncbi:MAG: bifunctional pyr operon transcriptional regulator/uracil phosphoribosyltransferase PyrR [Bacilli bacterium]